MRVLTDGLNRLLGIVIGVCLAVMVVLVFGNVVLRYAFNSGITISEEISRWLFLWMTFLGAIIALRENAHLGTDVLTSRLPLVGQRICAVLARLLMLYISWLLLSGSWAQMQINLDVQAPVSGASMAIFYGSGFVFGLASMGILAVQLWQSLKGDRSAFSLSQESEELTQYEARLDEAKQAR
ncbi:C4-dicarboxylate ABC transporter permease [Cupriavidus necator]|uniref:TRAP transporter small permease n=1 Tax=Cupriavidus TaxID=106589 RepID=UPI00039AFAA9|nr:MULTISPECIES: TRAP transporter small permease [Cupriavidus]KUE85979.1 C4-dicarboxylate ABC transporter permease [Cupriavidus necator]